MLLPPLPLPHVTTCSNIPYYPPFKPKNLSDNKTVAKSLIDNFHE